MPFDAQDLAIPPGHKFYHTSYDLHSCHILQLVTDLHYELNEFRKFWTREPQTEVFIENIVDNLEFLCERNKTIPQDQEDDRNTASSSKGKGKGKEKASAPSGDRHASGSDYSRAGPSTAGQSSSSRTHTLKQEEPEPFTLTLRTDGVCKPLTIKLPPVNRSEPADSNGESSRSTTHANSSTKAQKGHPSVKPDPEIKEEPDLDDILPPRQHHWRHQVFKRNYTAVCPITKDTPRYQPRPRHPRVTTDFPYGTGPLPGPSRTRLEDRVQHDREMRQIQNPTEQGSNVAGPSHQYQTRSSRRRSPSCQRMGAQCESKTAGSQKDSKEGSKTAGSQKNSKEGSKKRRREGDDDEAKEEGSRSRKKAKKH